MFWRRSSDGATLRSAAGENRKSASPEKEDRYYTTRGSAVADEIGKVSGDGNNGEERALVWPKLYISLSSKEKEEDFLAMKGCKLPQRPKKRAKIIQRSLLVSIFFFFKKKTPFLAPIPFIDKSEVGKEAKRDFFKMKKNIKLNMLFWVFLCLICVWSFCFVDLFGGVAVGESWGVVDRYVPREIRS